MKLKTKLGSFAAAGLLVFAVAGTASADVKWATPDDWYSSADDAQGENSNDPAFWEDWFDLEEGDCEKIEGDALDAVMNEDGSASLGAAYDHVVVKQANPNAKDVIYDNTIFDDVAADETVFADTDGDGVYGEGDSGGISHIIVCGPGETTTTSFTSSQESSTTSTDTFTSSQQSTTVTQPPTDTIGAGGSGNQATGMWLLVAALGVLLGSLVVVAPARAKNKS